MNYVAISKELRNTLKARGITYKDLMAPLGMTESGIKKLLTGNDISLNKLETILRFADIDMADLLVLSRGGHQKPVKLTKVQEDLLLKNSSLYNMMVHLAMFEGDLGLIKKMNPKLTKKKFEQILDQLSVAGLIEISNGVVVRYPQAVDMSPKLSEVFMGSLKSVVHDKSKDSVFDCLLYVELSQKSAKDFKVALQRVVDEFIARSERERKVYSRKDLKFIGTQLTAVSTTVNSLFPLT